jgi:hypothetical protein
MDRASFQCRPANQGAPIQMDWMIRKALDEFRRGIVGGSYMVGTTLEPEKEGILCPAQARRCLKHSVKHWL